MAKEIVRIIIFLIIFTGNSACMKYRPADEENFDLSGRGLFTVCEGNFMSATASLSLYDPESRHVENEVFFRANSMKLGDVAQSMVIREGKGYIVVNQSGVVFVIDIVTFVIEKLITGLTSPRYIHFLNDRKAYISDLYSGHITIINPDTGEITGYIETKGHKSTEQMVQYGKYVFVSCWSYDRKILVIDSVKDIVVDSIETGIQPKSLLIDKYGKIWAGTDGGYEGSPYGWEAPALFRIDAATRFVEKRFDFDKDDILSKMSLNGTGDTLYYINRSVWKMDVASDRLPIRPFVEYSGTIYNGIGIDPETSEIYIADAVDYQQSGVVYRFSPQAVPVDTFRVGIIPSTFCFK